MDEQLDRPAFEVTDMSGRHYKIWRDGRIEGFDMKPCVVINRIPIEIARAVRREAAAPV
jgi:hypothetical protein